MKNKNILFAVLIGSAAILSVLWEWQPFASDRSPLDALDGLSSKIPSRPIELTETEQARLKGARAEKRLILIDGQAWVVTLIDGSNNRHSVHDPMYCFVGDGWKVENESDTAIPMGECKQVQLSRKDSKMEVVYWFSNGEKRFNSVIQQWLYSSIRRLSMGAWSQEPILVLAHPLDPGPIALDSTVKSAFRNIPL